MVKWIAGLLLLGSVSGHAGYKPLKNECDGLPSVAVGSISGTCVGLMAADVPELKFIKPRKALELPEANQILVTDMGGWNPGRGVLWLIEFSGDDYSKPAYAGKLAENLVLPHDIKRGKDGLIYLGEANRITRFSVKNRKIQAPEIVVSDLPYPDGKNLHPLTSFVFTRDNDLLINTGSRTDDCGLKERRKISAGKKNNSQCEEVPYVGLRRYRFNKETGLWGNTYDMYATGLRNSVALLVHDSGMILQAENSADLQDANEPYEEINIIKEGAFYGWPYCMNRSMNSGYRSNGCAGKNYTEPYSLMPPHTAPLDMIYYDHERLPQLQGKLLVSWHGYRVVGNRLVSYQVDNKGLPSLIKEPVFNRDPISPATEFTQHTFDPEGGSDGDAQHTEIIGYWNEIPGVRPEGAPVGLLQLKDGSLLIVDDKNKALLRLSEGQSYGEKRPVSVAEPELDKQYFSGARKALLTEHCAGCHSELITAPEILLNRSGGWLKPVNGITLIESKLNAEVNFMPPAGKLSPEQISVLSDKKN